MKNFEKPNLSLYFACLPAIGIWIRSDYENAKNYTQCVNLLHNWLNIADETNNIVKKDCYNRSASLLYQFLTNKTFESKKII